jgi:uncharacterized damage-inducible protein DinB
VAGNLELMSSVTDHIRSSLSSTRTELAEIFPHISDDMLDWAPAEGMRTIGGQFAEIMGTEVSIVERLSGKPRRPYPEIEAEFSDLNTVATNVAKLTEVRESTLELLRSLSEEQLSSFADVSDGTKAYMELDEIPVSEMFRYLIRHESYHTGQLVSYLWARGNNPYSWDEVNAEA